MNATHMRPPCVVTLVRNPSWHSQQQLEHCDLFLIDFLKILVLIENSKNGKHKKNKMETKKWMLSVLYNLMKRRCNRAFLLPVNPDTDLCPDYYNVIARPMDLGTIKNRIESDSLITVADFANDVKLVFENCIMYNTENSKLHQIAKSELVNFEIFIDPFMAKATTEKYSAGSPETNALKSRGSRKPALSADRPDFSGEGSADASEDSRAVKRARDRSRQGHGAGAAARCAHGNTACPDPACGGAAALCLHGRTKRRCKDPGCAAARRAAAAHCEHGKQRKYCKQPGCGGWAICEHGRQKYACRACGGSSICIHGRARQGCRCGPRAGPAAMRARPDVCACPHQNVCALARW